MIRIKNDNNILKIFGQNIIDLRKEKGISQEKLAELSNLHRTYIGGVERGERNLSLFNIIKIVNALNTNINRLFEGIK